jgi:hypothetical protein
MLSVIQPPSSGPITGATIVVIAQTDRAVPAFDFGKLAISSDWDSGIMGPATAPWMTRNSISMPIVGASAHRNEAATNSMTDHVNSLT